MVISFLIIVKNYKFFFLLKIVISNCLKIVIFLLENFLFFSANCNFPSPALHGKVKDDSVLCGLTGPYYNDDACDDDDFDVHNDDGLHDVDNDGDDDDNDDDNDDKNHLLTTVRFPRFRSVFRYKPELVSVESSRTCDIIFIFGIFFPKWGVNPIPKTLKHPKINFKTPKNHTKWAGHICV